MEEQKSSPRYQVVNRWIDTFILNVKGQMPQELANQLQQYQDQAREQEEDVLTPWVFQGCPLAIKPHGSGHGWRWLLYSDDLHLQLGRGKWNGTVCRLTFRSVYLHSRDFGDALSQVYVFLVAFLGYEPALQVSSLDQCLDLAGWVLTGVDAERFVSRGSLQELPADEVEHVNPEVDRRGRRIKALYFSKTAPHSCCIYDKTAEVKVHHKEWFYEVWKRNGWDGETPVTRIEFRYERECLREMGIECPFDLLDQLDSLWAYSTRAWLRHTVPSVDSNQSRWAVSEVWQVVQRATLFMTEAAPAARVKKIEVEATHTLAGFVGFGTSLAARLVVLHRQRAAHLGESKGGSGRGRVRPRFARRWGGRRRAGLRGGRTLRPQRQRAVPGGLPALPLEAVGENGSGFLAWVHELVHGYLVGKKRATFGQVTRRKLAWLGQPQVAAA
jgi:hypothetical protein